MHNVRINLIYHFYACNHTAAEDYFNDIITMIPSEYPHSVSHLETVYTPIPLDEMESAKARGLQIISMDVNDRQNYPHYVIRQLSISFSSSLAEYENDATHLEEEFGANASNCQIIFDRFLQKEEIKNE